MSASFFPWKKNLLLPDNVHKIMYLRKQCFKESWKKNTGPIKYYSVMHSDDSHVMKFHCSEGSKEFSDIPKEAERTNYGFKIVEVNELNQST